MKLPLTCVGLLLHLTLGVGSCTGAATDADFVQLGNSLTGDVYLSGSSDYKKGSTLLNTRFSVAFRAVVYVKTTEDVRDVLLFCRQHDLTPTLRSSGHDYIGRSSCKGSVSINMRRMTETTIRTDPSGNKVIDAEPGINMGELYQIVDKEGLVLVGGSAHTVASGGWATGGGHSPMSRMYGLGVDNTLGFTLVTANGTIIKLTNTGGAIKYPGEEFKDFSDPELFWAVRGGGGGTFGVVTSFTYKLHPAPPDGFVQILIILSMKDPVYGNTGDKILNKFKQYLRYNLTANWGGYVLTSGYVGPTETGAHVTGVLTLSLLHVGGYAKAKDAVEHIWTWGTGYTLKINNTYSTFWEYEKSVNDPTGFRAYISNRLLQDKDMVPSSNLENVMTSIVETKEKTGEATFGCTVTLLGGKMRDYTIGSSSVSPNFRNALGSYSCGIGWEKEDHDDYLEKIVLDYSDKMNTLGEGVYLNEPNAYLPNWKIDYWGSLASYERLLAVKKRVDPDNLFWCYHCVGSDLVKDNPCRGCSISAATFTTLLLTSVLVYYISKFQSG